MANTSAKKLEKRVLKTLPLPAATVQAVQKIADNEDRTWVYVARRLLEEALGIPR